MWKTSVSPRRTGLANPQAGVENWVLVHRVTIQPVSADLSTGRFFAFSTWICGKKKIGAEKCPHGAQREELMLDVISRTADCRGRGVLQAHFHLADGVNDGGVISSKFRPISGRERLVNWRIRYMATCRASAVPLFFEGAAQDGFVNGIEPANLADDEGRGGNGVSSTLNISLMAGKHWADLEACRSNPGKPGFFTVPSICRTLLVMLLAM